MPKDKENTLTETKESLLSQRIQIKKYEIHLHLHSFPANAFTSTILLDSISKHQYILFVFLSLIYFTLYNRL